MPPITLSYGRSGLTVDLPVAADVLRPRHTAGPGDEAVAIRAALANPFGSQPLAARVKPGDRVVVAHSDITRATPNKRLLPVLLAELEAAGVRRADITLLNALGTHRQQTPAELRAMLGDFVVDHYRCLQHDAYEDANLVSLGQTSFGHPVRLNRALLEADFKILTGFIEPHFFAGFSGGPKGVLPALAGAESVLTNHGFGMVGDPRATWGICEGNPIWEEMREMALRVTPAFLVNLTLNVEKQITGVFAGDLLEAHRAGREFVREHAMVKVAAPYDVILTTNSGYPLDQNLYQTVKGMSAASQVIRSGGAILMVAGCEDGLPNHGLYAKLLAEAGSPDAILQMLAQPGYSAQDQWQVQVQATIQKKADVYVYSTGLSDEQIRRALFTPCRDIPTTLLELVQKHGPRVCVIPDGPLTIAYL
jgi:nickel-dependent lactate racemase